MKKRILIVDDDPRILVLIKEALEEEVFIVCTASSSYEAIEKAQQMLPDLILLDIVLPGSSGWETCRILKNDINTKDIPIIFISGTAINSNDKIKGLDIGAFDYITKPFHSGELIARVKAVLRREEMKKQPALDTKNGNLLVEGNITICFDDNTVRVNNKPIKLRPKEACLLIEMIKQKGKVLNRKYIFESVWGKEFSGSSRTVDMTVKRLRKKLGEAARRIVTVQTVGYKFTDK